MRAEPADLRAADSWLLPPVLERLGLSAETWMNASTDFRQHYRNGELRLNKAA